MTIGKLQPFTKGHINMIEEGEELCIVYRINTDDKIPETLKGWKVKGRVVKKDAINNVVNFLNNNGEGDLTEQEKELIKRPFTNDLINKELEIVKKNTKNILDVIPVKNMYDALDKFNAFCTEHQDEYEPNYWMCGDDRVEVYSQEIGRYDELETEFKSGKTLPNILKGKLQTNTGKGRTEGVSGTAVRKSIITKDKAAFEKIMPKGVGSMFDDFTDAFDKYKNQLQSIIKEWKMTSLKDYIVEAITKELSKNEFDKVIEAILNNEYVDWYKENISKYGDEKEANEWINTAYDDDRTAAELCMFIETIVGHHNFDMHKTIESIFKNKDIRKKFNI